MSPLAAAADAARAPRRIALVGRYPRQDPGSPPGFWPNNGLHRIRASLEAHPSRPVSVQTWELRDGDDDIAATARAIRDAGVDAVFGSAFLWSGPTLVALARELRGLAPDLPVVLGGPWARPVMASLTPFRDLSAVVDALVDGDGEQTARDLVDALPERPDRKAAASAFASVRGLHLPSSDGTWRATPPRPPTSDLDSLVSPWRSPDEMPRGAVAYLQTFRGCPLSCTFCEWGRMADPRTVCSVETIAAELEGFARADAVGALLVDAGLNLNRRAFANLAEAERRVGFFRERMLICEVYPTLLADEHLRFLEGVGEPIAALGVQTFDPEALKAIERPFDETRFMDAVDQLGAVADLTIELILGLPGDTPEAFAYTLERALALPAHVRVYHCVVLPSALMARSPPEHALRFDPHTLKMQSCYSWPEDALARATERLASLAAERDGATGRFWWFLPRAR